MIIGNILYYLDLVLVFCRILCVKISPFRLLIYETKINKNGRQCTEFKSPVMFFIHDLGIFRVLSFNYEDETDVWRLFRYLTGQYS